MPSLENLALFALASVLLALTPGPNLLYLVSRTLCQGRRAGIVSLAGTSLGFVFHVLAAALGLSAIFLTVPLLYDLLRYAGAAYLLWLAWGAVRPGGGAFAARTLPEDPPARLFRMGLLTSVLNPKIALFYLALPHFNPDDDVEPLPEAVAEQARRRDGSPGLTRCLHARRRASAADPERGRPGCVAALGAERGVRGDCAQARLRNAQMMHGRSLRIRVQPTRALDPCC